MKKTLRVTLEVDVVDLPKRVRREMAAGLGAVESDVPRLVEHPASVFAPVFENIGNDELSCALFDGLEAYARFSRAAVIEISWKASPIDASTAAAVGAGRSLASVPKDGAGTGTLYTDGYYARLIEKGERP